MARGWLAMSGVVVLAAFSPAGFVAAEGQGAPAASGAVEDDDRLSDPRNWTSADMVGTWRDATFEQQIEDGKFTITQSTTTYGADGRFTGEGLMILAVPPQPSTSGRYLASASGRYEVAEGLFLTSVESASITPDLTDVSDPDQALAMKEFALAGAEFVLAEGDDVDTIVRSSHDELVLLIEFADGLSVEQTMRRE